ncbi:MAG: helix-turn-helix transcriptional regulator [Christensenellaceae bacterium]
MAEQEKLRAEDIPDEEFSLTGGAEEQGITISSDLIRGHINTIILRSLYDGDKYGYDIINEIEKKSGGLYTLKQPTLYSALKRLETLRYVESYYGDFSNGGRRKYFRLTDKGKEITERNLSEWEYSRTIIDSLISDGNAHYDFSFITEKQKELLDIKKTLAARESALEDERNALNNLKNELQRERSLLSVQSSSLSTQKSDFNELKDKINAQKAELEEKQRILSEKQGEIDDKEIELNEKQNEIREAKAELERQRGEIDALKNTVEFQKIELDDKITELDEVKASTVAQSEELEEKQSELSSLQEELAQKQDDLLSIQAELEESAPRSKRQKALAERESAVSTLQSSAADKESELAARTAALEAAETRLADKQKKSKPPKKKSGFSAQTSKNGRSPSIPCGRSSTKKPRIITTCFPASETNSRSWRNRKSCSNSGRRNMKACGRKTKSFRR